MSYARMYVPWSYVRPEITSIGIMEILKLELTLIYGV